MDLTRCWIDSGVGMLGRTWDMCTDRQLQAKQLLVFGYYTCNDYMHVITLVMIVCMSVTVRFSIKRDCVPGL